MIRIAIVGMACCYPDASSPRELWENVVASRRAFRRLPDVRMRLADYWDADPTAPDRFYSTNAAVIEGYEFDRIAHKIAGSTYRSTDLTHWLALDVAERALADAGFPQGEGLPKQRTGVVVGNTLTGEFARAGILRLRWPYVRRVVTAALSDSGWPQDRLAPFLDELERRYKDPFPPVDEDSLAGGLSNTIAGRICGYFDFRGGGYTVDGACSSSLLSVVTAGKALLDGDVDVAIAGGVDLSIDPFETIGFAKTGALSRTEMRVYDRRSDGFWPGEGCGMVVLMREADAKALGCRRYAAIAGWGVSSDGRGSITRPEIGGYRLALSRAYAQAGFGIDTVALFEGHGTGTQVGDATELTALAQAREAAGATSPAVIGSIKAMIGHTKAAAGVAGLIKAALAVHEQVLPPTVGCFDPHPLFGQRPELLRVLRKAEPWPTDLPIRAGITSMGFGGINTHVVLAGAGRRRRHLDTVTLALAASGQDAEIVLLDARSPAELRDRLAGLASWVVGLSYAQLADLAAAARLRLSGLPCRAAVVASSPREAAERLHALVGCVGGLSEGGVARTPDGFGWASQVTGPPRIGYLFPGQGSGHGTTGGALRRRFGSVDEIYLRAALPAAGDMSATAIAQPRIVTGSIAGLRIAAELGLSASVAVGHSLGEISALHWAGAMDDQTLLAVATVRGQTMTEHSDSGIMASITASLELTREFIDGLPVVIAGYNGPAQTVISGPADAVGQAGRRAEEAHVPWVRLAVSHAFHSPLVAPAAEVFASRIAGQRFRPVGRQVVSTVTGGVLASDTDVPALLRRQITDPVLFSQALELAAREADLLVEVGPGRILTGLASQIAAVPAVALDTDDESLASLLNVVAAAYVLGAPVATQALFRDRLVRPLEIGADQHFFASPCEQAPAVDAERVGVNVHALADGGQAGPDAIAATALAETGTSGEPAIEALRRHAAQRAELPIEIVGDDSRLLDDLHLSSITVGQLVNEVALSRGIAPAMIPASFATSTLRELADAIDLMAFTDSAPVSPAVAGAADWIQPFSVEFEAEPVPQAVPEENGEWQVFCQPGHPFAASLADLLADSRVGSGILVCLPDQCAPADLRLALDGAKAAFAAPPGTRFVLVQHGRGAAGLAKTLRLEAPKLRVTIAVVPPLPAAARWVAAEVAATTGFAEAHYDEAGLRRVPVLKAMPVRPDPAGPWLRGDDVLLVTGGGKGITAECALALASDSGARLAILGRSDPGTDPELAGNLARMSQAGARVSYVSADVTSPDQVRAAIATVTSSLGPVTAVLHGAGRNEPAALANLDLTDVTETMAPKIDGLRTVLAAIGSAPLRLLVTFGSIIGRSGLSGEAHYAIANEWLTELTEVFAASNPGCRCLCLEWSVWSGTGMGERLSVVESLANAGITPISPDRGVQIMRQLLADPDAPPTVVISGRTGTIDTIRRESPELPLLRFVERPLVRYHRAELVTEVDLNVGTDKYLADHRLDDNLLFPAVFGLEAMVQVAMAATGRIDLPVIEKAEFSRPVVVPPAGSTTIRIAATVTADDEVEAAIRSAETGFSADHFRARLRFTPARAAEGLPEASDELPMAAIDPVSDLYGTVLFQGSRFQRLRGYHRAAARYVDADVAAMDGDWFAGYLPATLLLGDPGARDALMHGNQVCVPDATLLPVGVERIYPAGDKLAAAGELRYCAAERHQDGDTYTYDIAVRMAAGPVVERWEGLRLRAVRKDAGRGPWVIPLLGPYLERAIADLTGAPVAVAVEPHAGVTGRADRRAMTALAAGRALGRRVAVRYRPDGRPETDGAEVISASHGPGLTLCVAAKSLVSCDTQAVEHRPASAWLGLLGSHEGLARLLAGDSGEEYNAAATRVWAAIECLHKAGLPQSAPLIASPPTRPGWQVLNCGPMRIATFVTTLRDVKGQVAFAVLTEEGRS